MSQDELFRVIYGVSLVLMLSAVAFPLARSSRRWLRHAAIWVLAGGSFSPSTSWWSGGWVEGTSGPALVSTVGLLA